MSLVAEARRLGFVSINVDLIYGLPKQTSESFARTLAQVNELRPDRIALYAYAHLPERFKPQRRIASADLPMGQEKLNMLSGAIDAFMNGGYVYVGMDHFALPDDSLAIAKRQGRLHRNFQGYSTQPDCDLIALGVSAIGKVGPPTARTSRPWKSITTPLMAACCPCSADWRSRDDLVRRAIIMAIMCQGSVLYEPMEQAWLINFREYFARELAALAEMQRNGLVQLSDEGFKVTGLGWFCARSSHAV